MEEKIEFHNQGENTRLDETSPVKPHTIINSPENPNL